MSEIHALLKRQLKKVGVEDLSRPPEGEAWSLLLERLSAAYTQADQDRYTLERSLHLCSQEMQDLNRSIEANHRELLGQQKALSSLTKYDTYDETDLGKTFRHITSLCAHTIGVERASLWRFTLERDALECVDLYVREGDAHSSGARLLRSDFPGYFEALGRDEVISATDAARDPRTREFADVYLAPLGITSMLDIPLFLRGELQGVLCHEHTGAPRTWSPDEITFGVAAANMIALAYDHGEMRQLHDLLRDQNQRLERKVQSRTRELRETQYEVIRRLSRAAEFRDNDTGDHIHRMSLYCAVLGRHAGLSESQVELLRNASAMHDIGKIAIPDRILLKPGPLDEEERRVMETHCELGARMLEGNDSELMKMALRIAWTHHEKWDGTGYPRRISGEKIPLEGRICALADVFDALVSERPYKKPWPVERAAEQIRRGTGTHFDPDLVACFERGLDEFLALQEGAAAESFAGARS